MATSRARRPTRRRRPRTGRWYAALLLVVLAVVGAMAAGPLTDYTAATARVDELTAQRDALHAEVADLRQREEDLHDPASLELAARDELGMVRPGEVPYIVITPQPTTPSLVPSPTESPDPRPWYQRALDTLIGWVS